MTKKSEYLFPLPVCVTREALLAWIFTEGLQTSLWGQTSLECVQMFAREPTSAQEITDLYYIFSATGKMSKSIQIFHKVELYLLNRLGIVLLLQSNV